MLKYFTTIFFMCMLVYVSAQQNKIDSLKKKLPLLHDSAKVDCMLKISFSYGHFDDDSDHVFWQVNTDSAVVYASKAMKEAKELRYLRGMANAFENLGEMASVENYEDGEKYFRQAILCYNQIKDFANLSWSNLWLGYYLMYQGKFIEARRVYEKALSYYQQADNKARQARTYGLLGNSYILEGYYAKALDYILKDIAIIKIQIKYKNDPINATIRMAELYEAVGDTLKALEFYRQSAGYAKRYNVEEYYEIKANISFLENNYDSALYYRKLVGSSTSSIEIGEIYLLKKEYAKALPYFINNLVFRERQHVTYSVMILLDDIAKDYMYQNDRKASLKYARQLYKTATETHARKFIKDGNWLLWKIYDAEKNTDSAYKYRLQFDIINDSIAQDQLARDLAVTQLRFDDEQKQSQIDLLKKDNQINQEELKSESFQKKILVAVILTVAFISFIAFRNFTLKRRNEKLENEKKQSELQTKASELEMQALRSQMNPHFIFNCLSSINRFILKNEMEEASGYLTKFSRLIRMVLVNSKKQFISLEDEMETLCLYLDMEKLRFKNSFDYKISFVNSIDAGNIFVPPMLLQPFAENAIWHGLMHKEGHGYLEIKLSSDGKFLICTITDNGIGRTKASELKSKSAEKQKSMGLEITKERLALLNKVENNNTSFVIEDLFDEGIPSGTQVVIKMIYKNLVEATS